MDVGDRPARFLPPQPEQCFCSGPGLPGRGQWCTGDPLAQACGKWRAVVPPGGETNHSVERRPAKTLGPGKQRDRFALAAADVFRNMESRKDRKSTRLNSSH